MVRVERRVQLVDTVVVTLLHWQRYAALGEPGEWNARLAEILHGDAELRGAAFEVAEFQADTLGAQVGQAIAQEADLASIQVAGLEQAGADALARELEGGVSSLKSSGCDVLLVTCADPRFATFNAHLWNIARTHAAIVLDLWGTSELGTPQLAMRAAHALGIPYYESRSRPPKVDFGNGFKR